MTEFQASRRTVMKGAAWAAPAVALARPVPSVAASEVPPTIDPVEAAAPGKPTEAPLVVKNPDGTPFPAKDIVHVSGLPDGLSIAKDPDDPTKFVVIGTIPEDYAGEPDVTVLVNVTGEDGKVYNDVPFELHIPAANKLCDGDILNWPNPENGEGLPTEIGIYAGLEARVEAPKTPGGNDLVYNAPVAVKPNPEAGNITSITVTGLPEGLELNPEDLTLGGITHQAGDHPIKVLYQTDKNVGCEISTNLHVEPSNYTIHRVTADSTGSGGQADIIGYHITNTSDSPLCGPEGLTVRIYNYWSKGAYYPLASSIGVRGNNITTLTSGDTALTGGPTTPWNNPAGARLQKSAKGQAGAYGTATTGAYVRNATSLTWEPFYPDISNNALKNVQNWSAYVRDGNENVELFAEQTGSKHAKEGTMVWIFQLAPGSCMLPGETFHFQMGIALSAWRFTAAIETESYGSVNYTATDDTGVFYHKDWNNPLAKPLHAPGYRF